MGLSRTDSGTSHPAQVRNHHWFLGSLLILAGSWITHTTTATIALPEKVLTQTPPIVVEPTIATNNNSEHKNSEQNSTSTSPTESVEQAAEEQNFTMAYHTVKRGESLGTIFRNKSLDMSLPHAISTHDVAKQLVSLSIGKQISFKFDEFEQLKGLSYPINALEKLDVTFENNQISKAIIEELPYETQRKSVSAEIDSSLYEAALDVKLSNNLIMEMVRIFGWDIDFVLDIRRGDNFHVIYTEHMMGDQKLSDGNILAAEFTTQGNTYRAIRFEDNEGNASYYTPEGESMLGTFLRSPVEFSRISSRFGRRKHPISKKWKTHKGVDYAAARGTPIRATADGKITLAGRKGGYGNTVVINHAGRFSTLYAHMTGFAKGIKSGSRVKQGQTIGYVGSTGYSTGPHLHYEFRVDGVHRNSLTYKTPKASSVKKELKAQFDQIASSWGRELSALRQNYQIAKAPSNSVTL